MYRDTDTTRALDDLAEAGLIPPRAVQVFAAEGCNTLGDVLYLGRRRLMLMPGIGPKTIKGILAAAAADNLWVRP